MSSTGVTERVTRRPIQARSASWSLSLARWLQQRGVRPNQVSVFGVVLAAFAALCLVLAGRSEGGARVAYLLAAAVAMPLRLLCNMLDGLLAVEGGLKSARGDLYNELPDRLADLLILVGAGYGIGNTTWGPQLGWAAGTVALLTAYVRTLGAALGTSHYFTGPMDKPRRMHILIAACVLSAVETAAGWPQGRVLAAALIVVIVGGVVTVARRLRRIVAELEGQPVVASPARGILTSTIAGSVALLARVASGPSVRCVAGTPCPGQCILFANHGSHLDFVVLWSVLPRAIRDRTRPVAAKDYWEANAIRRFAATRVFRAVLVERDGNLGQLRAQIEQLTAALDAGDSLILFPEGTRGSGREMATFKSGLDFLARKRPQVALVPVYLDNLQRIMPKGEFLPVPQLSQITFGAPMHLEPGEQKADFLARAREAVASLQPKRAT